jgi:hypothetical protein
MYDKFFLGGESRLVLKNIACGRRMTLRTQFGERTIVRDTAEQ